MGFGQKSYQSPSTNFQAVRGVNGTCGTTGNVSCTTSVIYPSATSQALTVTSCQLISNTNNI